MAEFNPYEMVGKIIELRETPGFIWEDNEAGVEDTPTILNGEYEVVEWDPGNYEFGLVTKEEGETSRTIPDDEPFTPTIYWVSSEYVDVPEEIVNEVEQLEQQYEMPAVQHPVEPNTAPVQDFDPNALVGQFTVLDEVPCEDLQTGQTEYITGMLKVLQWDEANYGFILQTNDDLQEQYWAPAEYVVPNEIAEPEVDMLDEQYGMPAVEHPLGEHTGAKVDFSNHLAIYRDPRPIGQFTKSEDGNWLAQISVNSRVPNNRRLPSAGDEALLKRGDSYYSVILQDRVNDPSDEINSVWTFEDAPEQNIDPHTASGLIMPGPGEEAKGHHEFTPNPESSDSGDIAAAAAGAPPPPPPGDYSCPNCESNDVVFNKGEYGIIYLICNSCGEAFPLTPEGEIDEGAEELRRFLESRVEVNRSSVPDEHLGFYEAADLAGQKPFEETSEFTDEEYASLSPEFQADLRRVINSLRDSGVSQEDMHETILGLIHDYIRSGRSASEVSDQVRADIARIAEKLRGAGYDAKMIQDQIKRILEEEQDIDSSFDRQQMPTEHLGWYQDNQNRVSSFEITSVESVPPMSNPNQFIQQIPQAAMNLAPAGINAVQNFVNTEQGGELANIGLHKGVEESLMKGVEKGWEKLPTQGLTQGVKNIIPNSMGGLAEGAAGELAGKVLGPVGWASFGDSILDATGLTHDTRGDSFGMNNVKGLSPIEQGKNLINNFQNAQDVGDVATAIPTAALQAYQNSPVKWGIDNAVQPATEWAGHAVVDTAKEVGNTAVDAAKGFGNAVGDVAKGVGGLMGFSNYDPAVDRASVPDEHLGWYYADFQEKGTEENDGSLPNVHEELVMPDEPKGLEKD